MGIDPFVVFRTIFFFGLIALLGGGVYLARNYERVFGADGSIPSESESARFYTKTEVFLVWASAVKVCLVVIFFM
jgi:hypothetical protein